VRRVVVHIDRLVLRGIRPEDRHQVAERLRTELAASLGESQAAAGIGRIGAIAHLRAGRFSVVPGATPGALGTGAARSIRQAIRS
jgi:hypothetical protein